jgi:Fe-S-cluster containining protein
MDFGESPREFFERQESRAKAAIGAAKNVADLKAITAQWLVELDEIFAEVMIRTRSSIACQRGCFYCCYLKVDVTPAEAFILADFVKESLRKEETDRVLGLAAENQAKISQMNFKQHLGSNLPCPFLKNGQCVAYSVRPSMCRMFHAQTVQTCKESFEKPDDLDAPDSQVAEIRVLLGMARAALDKGHKALGFDRRPYDLNSGLLEAVEDSDCEVRWWNKKGAFSWTALAKDFAEGKPGRVLPSNGGGTRGRHSSQ